jgi:hypothetical protein
MSSAAALGLNIGYTYTSSAKKEVEGKKGKKDYQVALNQANGVVCVAGLLNQVFPRLQNLPRGVPLANTLMPFAALMLYPLVPLAKDGYYEQAIKCIPAPARILPSRISDSTLKVLSFVSDNSNYFAGLGLIAAAMSFPLVGMGALAAGVSVPLAYHAMESADLVPTKVSLAVDQYMPSVMKGSVLVYGDPLSKLISAISLSSEIPGASVYIQKKVEKAVKRIHKSGPTLDEIDAPWEKCNELPFDVINRILDDEDPSIYEINVPHCSKQACVNVNFAENHEFIHFLTLFDSVQWQERYEILKKKFQDDDNFIDFVKKEIFSARIEIQKDVTQLEAQKKLTEKVQQNVGHYIERLAWGARISKEKYLAQHLKKQMTEFVRVLCEEKDTDGSKDLEETKNYSNKILAYLFKKQENSTKSHVDIVEFEDILMKLAVEGGDYCPKGLKRVTLEIFSGLEPSTTDEIKKYELKIYKQLQLTRKQILQENYLQIMEGVVNFFKGGRVRKLDETITSKDIVAYAQDVSMMDRFRQYFSLGFYPLSPNERSQFGVVDYLAWSSYSPYRDKMYKTYYDQLDRCIQEVGESYFTDYILKKIWSMDDLRFDQRHELIKRLADSGHGDQKEKTIKGFHRLFFVMQGILKIKPSQHAALNLDVDDWVEIPDELLDWVEI